MTTWNDIIDELPDGWTLEVTPYTIALTQIRSVRVRILDKTGAEMLYKKLPVGEINEVYVWMIEHAA